MATKPFDLSKPDSIHPPVASVGTRMVAASINKYVDYLIKEANINMDLMIKEAKHRANKQLIEIADQYYERIPAEHR